jgi:hypothetical protein
MVWVMVWVKVMVDGQDAFTVMAYIMVKFVARVMVVV